MEEKQPRTKKAGGVRKRDKAVVKIAEAMNITLDPSILSVADMEGFPKLRDESERNQLIMCGLACGLSQCFIARALNVSQPTIWEIANRIDPEGRFKLSKNAKKAFITQLYETRGIEALLSITPEKLEESTAAELSRVSKTMAEAAQALNLSKHKELGASRLDALMSQMEREIDDAEFVEVNDIHNP